MRGKSRAEEKGGQSNTIKTLHRGRYLADTQGKRVTKKKKRRCILGRNMNKSPVQLGSGDQMEDCSRNKTFLR